MLTAHQKQLAEQAAEEHQMKTTENDTNSTFCEACGCRITQGQCAHGVRPPMPQPDNEDAQDLLRALVPVTISPTAANVRLLPPYTLAQVMENLSLMHGSQDLTWCRWVATDILERGIDALPTSQAQSRTLAERAAPQLQAVAEAAQSLKDEVESTLSLDTPDMQQALENLDTALFNLKKAGAK